jgi:hypothetical protein
VGIGGSRTLVDQEGRLWSVVLFSFAAEKGILITGNSQGFKKVLGAQTGKLACNLELSAEILSVIDLSTQNLQECCAVLNEFALPRAIVDFTSSSFVGWNSRFLHQTGCSEDTIRSAKPEELLAFGESWLPLSGDDGQVVEFTSCATKRPSGANPTPGYIIRTASKFGYVMLEFSDSRPAQFEQGRVTGREEERDRIIKAYHEEVSSSIIAVLFLIETAKNKLEEAGSPQAEPVSKASQILTETTEKIAEVLSNPDRGSQT